MKLGSMDFTKASISAFLEQNGGIRSRIKIHQRHKTNKLVLQTRVKFTSNFSGKLELNKFEGNFRNKVKEHYL